MYENYEAKERAGQIASTGAGYGGKGLDQMEFQREIKKIIESKTHGAEDDEIEDDGPPPDPEGYDTSGKAVVLRKPLKMTMREKALALIHDKYQPEGVQSGRNTTNATFFAEIEINDYPQLARFKVTSKEHVHKMCQVSGASITVRGCFVTPGIKPPFGERKLHLVL
jgi:ATP-dependent RNA helicase DDX46/PRP5